MFENNSDEVSELELQLKTWNKIEKNMKLIGFREGAAKGRDESLQEGFDVGFTHGLDLGEHVGQFKGILSCSRELTLVGDSKYSEENEKILSPKSCIMCLKGKNDAENKSENYLDINEVIPQQQKLSSEIISRLRNSSLYSYFIKT